MFGLSWTLIRRRAEPARTVGAAVVIGCAVGLATAAGLQFEFGADLRHEMSDSILPAARAGPVYVVGIDQEFIAAAKADPIGYPYQHLFAALPALGARIIYVDPGSYDVANPGIEERQFEALAANLLADADGVTTAKRDVSLTTPVKGTRIPGLATARSSDVLEEESDYVGFDNVVSDPEGNVLRTVPLVAVEPATERNAPRIVPSVSLISLIRARGLTESLTETADGIDVGGVLIPTEGDQRVRLSFAPSLLPGGDHIVPALDVTEGRIDMTSLEDSTVVVGPIGTASPRQLATPVGPGGSLSSTLIQANAINTLLTGRFLRPAGTAAVSLTAAAAAFVIALAVLFLPAWFAPIGALAAGAAWFWLTRWAAGRGSLLDPLAGFVAIVAATVAALVWRAAREALRRLQVTALFSRYVPATVVRQLLDESTLEEVEAGQRLEVAVLFCDLRGFTPMCARLEPARVREILDLYYSRATEVIFDHEGTLMQFAGDEVFAVFGAPLPQDDCAKRAVGCAADFVALQRDLCDELEGRGLPRIAYGVGVHSGVVVAAHFGSAARRQYTVIGDPVNVGARLCSHAEAGQAVVSERVMNALAEAPPAIPLGGLALKGIDRPVFCYALDEQLVGSTHTAVSVVPPPVAPSRPRIDLTAQRYQELRQR